MCERAVECNVAILNDWGSSMYRLRNSTVKEFCSLWCFYDHCAFLGVIFMLGFPLLVGLQWFSGVHIPMHGYGVHGRFRPGGFLPGIWILKSTFTGLWGEVAASSSSDPAVEISCNAAVGCTEFCVLKTWGFQWRVLNCIFALKCGLKLRDNLCVNCLECVSLGDPISWSRCIKFSYVRGIFRYQTPTNNI